MRDKYDRNLNYLRISVTDRCNLRCQYCMPEEGVEAIAHEEILTFDEILRLVGIMAGLGVNRVRLTGGEPLVRKNLPELIREIKGVPGIEFLGLTTNGVQFEGMARELLNAGVDGVNISLDTLDRNRFIEITRRDELDKVLRSIHKALELGFPQVKVNCVLAPDSTPEDWLGVASLAADLPIDVRFIEWMPIAGEEKKAISGDAILEMIGQKYGKLYPVDSFASGDPTKGGPAKLWQNDSFKGRIGLIHAMSHNFCSSCNRLRLTASGDLKLCLFYDTGISLKDLLRSGADDETIAMHIKNAAEQKPKQHAGKILGNEEGGFCSTIDRSNGMYGIGG